MNFSTEKPNRRYFKSAFSGVVIFLLTSLFWTYAFVKSENGFHMSYCLTGDEILDKHMLLINTIVELKHNADIMPESESNISKKETDDWNVAELIKTLPVRTGAVENVIPSFDVILKSRFGTREIIVIPTGVCSAKLSWGDLR